MFGERLARVIVKAKNGEPISRRDTLAAIGEVSVAAAVAVASGAVASNWGRLTTPVVEKGETLPAIAKIMSYEEYMELVSKLRWCSLTEEIRQW